MVRFSFSIHTFYLNTNPSMLLDTMLLLTSNTEVSSVLNIIMVSHAHDAFETADACTIWNAGIHNNMQAKIL